MQRLRIAVCDDEQKHINVISGALKSIFSNYGAETDIRAFSDGRDLLNGLDAAGCDLVFLDINMPSIDGLELGRILKNRDAAPEIIYVSGREDLVYETFRTHPFGFVRKSKFMSDINDVVGQYLSQKSKKTEEEQLVIGGRDEKRIVKYKDIVYIEGKNIYQNLFLSSEAAPVEIRSTIDKLEKELKDKGFFRIHKGYLINLNYVKKLDGNNNVILTNGAAIPISRAKTAQFKDEFYAYLRRKKISAF